MQIACGQGDEKAMPNATRSINPHQKDAQSMLVEMIEFLHRTKIELETWEIKFLVIFMEIFPGRRFYIANLEISEWKMMF